MICNNLYWSKSSNGKEKLMLVKVLKKIISLLEILESLKKTSIDDLHISGSEVRVPLGESIWILAKWFWRESTESICGFCEKQLRESTLNKEQFYFEIDAQCTYICNVTCYGWGPGAHLKTPVGSKGYESSRVLGIFRPKNKHPDFWGTNSEFWGCQKPRPKTFKYTQFCRPNPQPEPNSP